MKLPVYKALKKINGSTKEESAELCRLNLISLRKKGKKDKLIKTYTQEIDCKGTFLLINQVPYLIETYLQ